MTAQVRGQLKVRDVATDSQLQKSVTDFDTSTACFKIKPFIEINACFQKRPGHKAGQVKHIAHASLTLQQITKARVER
jgi:hypothetical protein